MSAMDDDLRFFRATIEVEFVGGETDKTIYSRCFLMPLFDPGPFDREILAKLVNNFMQEEFVTRGK